MHEAVESEGERAGMLELQGPTPPTVDDQQAGFRLFELSLQEGNS